MSGAPDGMVLRSMATCAGVTLLITILALLNAGSLAGIIDNLFSAYHRYSTAKIEQSLVFENHKERRASLEKAQGYDKNSEKARRSTSLGSRERSTPSRVKS